LITRNYLIFLFFFCNCFFAFAQKVEVTNNKQIDDLVQSVLLKGCVSISNIETKNNGKILGISSYGEFLKASSDFPFEKGIVLSTGNAIAIGNSDLSNILTVGEANEEGVIWGADKDLETALGISNTFNSTSIEFDVVSPFNELSFNYIFASEEYDTRYQCGLDVSDGLVFLIKETGSSDEYQNMALVPNTTDPIRVKNIHRGVAGECLPKNAQFFQKYRGEATNFEGITKVLNVTSSIVPGKSYHIKISIADHGDAFYDSALFIESIDFLSDLDLGDDIETCLEEVLLSADISNEKAVYSWFLNEVLIEGENNRTLLARESGTYKVKINVDFKEVCEIEDEIIVKVNKEMDIPNISDFQLCNTPGSVDDIAVFDLETKDSEIINLLEESEYVISYHYSDEDARANESPIVGNFENTSNPQKIYVRVLNNLEGCLGYSSFNIEVLSPEVSLPNAFEICASPVNSEIGNTDFTQTINDILEDYPNYTIDFFKTEKNAIDNENVQSLPYEVKSPGERVYMRVTDQLGCSSITYVDVNVLNSPKIVYGNYILDKCDATVNFASFDLTTFENAIKGSLTNVNFSYHENINDLNDGNNPILDPENFQNTKPNNQSIYVRVTAEGSVCYSSEVISLYTDVIGSAFTINDVEVCDDISNDGEETLNLKDITNVFLNGLSDLTIKYYESISDRENDIFLNDEILIKSKSRDFYYTVEKDGCANKRGSFRFIVNPYFEISTVLKREICREKELGFNVDLSAYDNYVANEVPLTKVSYYKSQEDAVLINEPVPKSYTSPTNNLKLYARIENENSCIAYNVLEIDFVEPPILIMPDDIMLCDSDSDGKVLYNLLEKEEEIIRKNPGVIVRFYKNETDAINEENLIVDKIDVEVTTQDIYAKLVSSASCNQIIILPIVVSVVPEILSLRDFPFCGNITATEGEFVFSEKDDEILNGDIESSVFYYENLLDAENRNNEIDKSIPYLSKIPNEIYVRVESDKNEECYNTSSFMLVNGEPPVFKSPEKIIELCDTGENDGFETIDFKPIKEAMINGDEKGQNLTIGFYTSKIGAERGGPSLANIHTRLDNPYEVFARVETEKGCADTSESFIVRVYKRPVFVDEYNIRDCDHYNDIYDGKIVSNLEDTLFQVLDPRDELITEYYFDEMLNLRISDENVVSFVNDTNPQTVYAKVTNSNGCVSTVPILIEVDIPPRIKLLTRPYEFCETTSREIDLSEINPLFGFDTPEFETSYYKTEEDAVNKEEGTESTYTYENTNEVVFVRIENRNTKCFSVDSFQILINPNPSINILKSLETCEDLKGTGLSVVNLHKEKDNEILKGADATRFPITYFLNEDAALMNETPLGFETTVGNNDVIWYRIVDKDPSKTTTCSSIGSFTIVVYSLPEIIEIPEEIPLCLNGELDLKINDSSTDSYDWYYEGELLVDEVLSNLKITKTGRYSVVVTDTTNNQNCQNEKEFRVTDAGFLRVDVKHFKHPNSVTVFTFGEGEYEYLLNDDESTLQDSNIFIRVSAGESTISVRQKFCSDFVTPSFYVLNYPQYFIPNGQASNTVWHLQGLESIPGVTATNVSVYDRYGVLIIQLSDKSEGWDGNDQNGKPLPATDYWFKADVQVDGKLIVLTGNFSLVR
jgi:gliding motility-associated-like protein